MGQGAAILPDGEFPVSWGRDPVRDALCVGDLPYSDEWRSAPLRKAAKKQLLFCPKTKRISGKMEYTFALEIFFFQPVPERKLAISLWEGNYCTATTKQRRVH